MQFGALATALHVLRRLRINLHFSGRSRSVTESVVKWLLEAHLRLECAESRVGAAIQTRDKVSRQWKPTLADARQLFAFFGCPLCS